MEKSIVYLRFRMCYTKLDQNDLVFIDRKSRKRKGQNGILPAI